MADINLNFDILKPEYVKAAVNNKVDGELFSDRIWNNKVALADEIKQSLIDAMKGNVTIDKIGQNIQGLFNVQAYESQRLVRTENARVQAQAIDDIAENCGLTKQMYCATLESFTCTECGELDGQYFDVDDESKPDIPQHPNCRCLYINVPFDGWQPTVRKDGETRDIIDYEDYNQWLKDNGIINPDATISSIMDNNNYFSDLELSKDAQKELSAIHDELNDFSIKNHIEKLITMNIDNAEKDFELTGNSNSVVFSNQLVNFLYNAADNSIILSHNHPSSSAFSSADLTEMARFKSLKYITVEGQNGFKYICGIGNGYRPSNLNEIRQAYNDIKYDIFDKYRNKVLNHELTEDEAWMQHSNEIMELLSKKFNWYYRRIK